MHHFLTIRELRFRALKYKTEALAPLEDGTQACIRATPQVGTASQSFFLSV